MKARTIIERKLVVYRYFRSELANHIFRSKDKGYMYAFSYSDSWNDYRPMSFGPLGPNWIEVSEEEARKRLPSHLFDNKK